MSYTITITGHREAGSVEEAQTFELELADKARGLVGELEAVTSATGVFSSLGQVDLTQPAGEAPATGSGVARQVAADARAFASELEAMTGEPESAVVERVRAFVAELDRVGASKAQGEQPAPAPAEPQ